MTRRDRIKQAVESDAIDGDSLDNLIRTAYWMGREAEAKSLGDKVAAHIKAQKQRASACRYHHMARAIVGTEDYICSGSYAGDYTASFGGDETAL